MALRSGDILFVGRPLAGVPLLRVAPLGAAPAQRLLQVLHCLRSRTAETLPGPPQLPFAGWLELWGTYHEQNLPLTEDH